jgi:hypothetical protein
MTNTTYRELANAVFDKIKDIDFANMDEEIAYQIVISYMRSAIVAFQSATQDLSDRDDELAQFNFRLSDNTFVILVNYMIIEWLTSNFILTSNALKSRLSTSDFHSLNLHNQLSKATELRNTLKAENDQLAINKSYKNSKIFDIVSKRKKV